MSLNLRYVACCIAAIGLLLSGCGEKEPDCTPATCASLGHECGVHDNNCGTNIFCGPCDDGFACQAGTCVAEQCVSLTCNDLGAECGNHSDGCGNSINCGECGSGHVCQGGTCVESSCVPHTCEDLGKDCGTWDDGCGRQIICGPCPDGYECRFDGQCVADCVPVTCSDVNAECGEIDNGCGENVYCGECPGDQVCGGGGPNRCGDAPCTAETCASLGYECGRHSDGCGNIITCGPCPDDERCTTDYQCQGGGLTDGSPCTTDSQCNGELCFYEDPDGFRSGYCTGICEENAHCNAGALCALGGLCFKSCSSDNDCRSDGYICRQDSQGRGLCLPGATGSGTVGDPCEGTWDCSGREHGACASPDYGWVNGYCTINCSNTDCPAGSVCVNNSMCLLTCDEPSDCRLDDYYACRDPGIGLDICFLGCRNHEDCGPHYCDSSTNTCVHCLESAHCADGETCENNRCVAGGNGCDVNGFSAQLHHAQYYESQNLLLYSGFTSDSPPWDVLSVEWHFNAGVNFTGPGIYPIETGASLSTCGLCVGIERIDGNGQVTGYFFATEGEVEVLQVGDDGETFSGVLRDAVLVEWDDVHSDAPIQGGQDWCIESYSWSSELFGQLPVSSDAILNEPLRDGQEPSGWSSSNVVFETGAGGYARLSTDAYLQTPVLDLSGYSPVTLIFDVAKYGMGGDGPVTVHVSDDGGATFTAQEYDSPVPTDGIYVMAETEITATGSQVVIRFTREKSPSQKRLRDVILLGVPSGQPGILNETLRDGQEPSGWSATNITWETGAGGYARFTNPDSALQTPVIDLSAYGSVTLEFEVAQWGSGDEGPLTVQVSNDGGSTWNAQQFDSPTPVDANYLTSTTEITATSSQTAIRFIRTNSPSQKRLRDVVLRAQ